MAAMVDRIERFPVFELADRDVEIMERDEETYATKEDRDVAVFMQIAERLSIQSLLHLLQGHAKSQVDSYNLDNVSVYTRKSGKRRKKKFRFAKQLCVTKVVENTRDLPLWWSEVEMGEMRIQAIETVKYFRKYRAKFVHAVEILAEDPITDQTKQQIQRVERSMKQITKDSYARGLEAHIVPLFGELRSESVHAVLLQQERLAYTQASDRTLALAQISSQYSKLSRCFSRKMGECDHIEALKATLGRWRPG